MLPRRIVYLESKGVIVAVHNGPGNCAAAGRERVMYFHHPTTALQHREGRWGGEGGGCKSNVIIMVTGGH